MSRFGSAPELWQFSVHNIKVLTFSVTLICKEGRRAGTGNVLLDLFCLEQCGEKKMPLQNIWFEQVGAISVLLYQHAATHKKTVRGGGHSSKAGTRKCCVMSNTQNKRMLSYSLNGIYHIYVYVVL